MTKPEALKGIPLCWQKLGIHWLNLASTPSKLIVRHLHFSILLPEILKQNPSLLRRHRLDSILPPLRQSCSYLLLFIDGLGTVLFTESINQSAFRCPVTRPWGCFSDCRFLTIFHFNTLSLFNILSDSRFHRPLLSQHFQKKELPVLLYLLDMIVN